MIFEFRPIFAAVSFRTIGVHKTGFETHKHLKFYKLLRFQTVKMEPGLMTA